MWQGEKEEERRKKKNEGGPKLFELGELVSGRGRLKNGPSGFFIRTLYTAEMPSPPLAAVLGTESVWVATCRYPFFIDTKHSVASAARSSFFLCVCGGILYTLRNFKTVNGSLFYWCLYLHVRVSQRPTFACFSFFFACARRKLVAMARKWQKRTEKKKQQNTDQLQ